MTSATAAPATSSDVRANPTSRRGEYVENAKFIKFLRRITVAAGKRVGAMDIDTLADLAAAVDEADRVLKDAARDLHDQGYSWGEIGRRLGVTRQAAYHRFGYRRTDPHDPDTGTR